MPSSPMQLDDYAPNQDSRESEATSSAQNSVIFGHAGGAALPAVLPPTQTGLFDERKASAQRWLDGIINSSSGERVVLAKRCLAIVNVISGHATLDCFSSHIELTTTLLLEFLGTVWMRDEHIHAAYDYIAHALGPDCRVLAMQAWHLGILSGFRRDSNGLRGDPNRPYNPRRPLPGDEAIASRKVDVVVVPVCIERRHWTQFLVDLGTRSILYRDSMDAAAQPNSTTLSDLQWWLSALLPGQPFSLSTAGPLVPAQMDGHSCGIILMAHFATTFANYPPWTQERWMEHRMEWFLRLAMYWLEDGLVSQFERVRIM